MYLQKSEILSERQGRFCISQKNSNLTDTNRNLDNVLKTTEVIWSGNITGGETATLNENMFDYRKIILEFALSNNPNAIGFVEIFPAILVNHFAENRTYYYSWTDWSRADTGNNVILKFLTETTIKIETANKSGGWIGLPYLRKVYGIK
jgi:hypothetical protein